MWGRGDSTFTPARRLANHPIQHNHQPVCAMIMIVIALGRAHMDSTPWTWNLATLAAFFFRHRWRRDYTPYMARFRPHRRSTWQPGGIPAMAGKSAQETPQMATGHVISLGHLGRAPSDLKSQATIQWIAMWYTLFSHQGFRP
jgi:hypothetical protein